MHFFSEFPDKNSSKSPGKFLKIFFQNFLSQSASLPSLPTVNPVLLPQCHLLSLRGVSVPKESTKIPLAESSSHSFCSVCVSLSKAHSLAFFLFKFHFSPDDWLISFLCTYFLTCFWKSTYLSNDLLLFCLL